MSIWFIRSNEIPVALRALIKEQGRATDRATYLAARRAVEAMAALAWAGRMRDLFHPITCSDGVYWRNGKWNTRSKPRREHHDE